MSALKEFFQNKQAQLEWAEFILSTMDEEVRVRVYGGKDTTGYKEARDIIAKSFKRLNELFTPKPKRRQIERAE